MIHILTDSCSDLNPELIEQFNVERIPLNVFINNQSYLDNIDISRQQLFAFVEEAGILPKTSAPTAEAMKRFLDREGEVIFISISSALSATYQVAVLAKNDLPNRTITVVDSRNLSTGIALLVLRAIEMRNADSSSQAILAEIENLIPRVHSSFVVDTLDYLYLGGRCTAIQHIFGSVLKIRPVIEVRPDGKLGMREKIGGSRRKALNSLLDDFRKNAPEIDPHRVFVTHTGCDDDAGYLEQEIRNILPIENLHITYAGSTISSHCGPNTIGILYMTRN
jgi:DegV family protein with EDD domain